MLSLADRLSLAPGVTAGDRHVRDEVRGYTWPANTTASIVLAAARSGATLGAAVERVSVGHDVPHETAEHDVLAFAWWLNRRYLVNVRPAPGHTRRRLVLAIRLLPAGVIAPGWARRRLLPPGSCARTLSVACALGPRVLLVALLAALPLLQLLGFTIAALAVAAATGSGLALHELGHALALGRRPAAVVVSGARTLVLHAMLPPGQRRLVALAGPGGVAAAGLVAAVLAEASSSLTLALCSAAWLAHAVGLTVLTGDGRNACSC